MILPDLRGHGRSPAPEGKYSMQEMAADILRIMDENSIERSILVGNSMGGYVSLAFAEHFPDRLSGLALVASHVYADSADKKSARLADIEKIRQTSVTDVLSGMPERLSRHPDVIEFCRERIAGADATGMIGVLGGMAERADAAKTFSTLKVPAMIIAGQEDQFIPIDLSRKMAQLMEEPRLVEIPNAGHLPMLDDPQLTYQALYKFIIQIIEEQNNR